MAPPPGKQSAIFGLTPALRARGRAGTRRRATCRARARRTAFPTPSARPERLGALRPRDAASSTNAHGERRRIEGGVQAEARAQRARAGARTLAEHQRHEQAAAGQSCAARGALSAKHSRGHDDGARSARGCARAARTARRGRTAPRPTARAPPRTATRATRACWKAGARLHAALAQHRSRGVRESARSSQREQTQPAACSDHARAQRRAAARAALRTEPERSPRSRPTDERTSADAAHHGQQTSLDAPPTDQRRSQLPERAAPAAMTARPGRTVSSERPGERERGERRDAHRADQSPAQVRQDAALDHGVRARTRASSPGGRACSAGRGSRAGRRAQRDDELGHGARCCAARAGRA